MLWIRAQSVKVHAVNWVRNRQNANIVMVAAWKLYQLDRSLCDQHAVIAVEPDNSISIRVRSAKEKDKM